MDSKTEQRKPNHRLSLERRARGWTQRYVAEQLGADPNIVSRWESGERPPGPYYHQKLCELFGKNAKELGLIVEQESRELDSIAASLVSQETTSAQPPRNGYVAFERRNTSPFVDVEGYTSASSPEDTTVVLEKGEPLAVVQGVPVILLHAHQTIDSLRDTSDATPEQKLGTLLALEANELATFFDEGWSVEELLATLRVVLSGARIMSKITRRAFGRKLFRFGVAAAVSGIPVPSGRHVSAEDCATLHTTLGESIAAGWKLFHTAGNPQVLAVGQAQLVLVQEASAYLYPTIRPIFYSSAYNLIGAAYHFQGRYNDAYKAHEQAYIAALEAMDVLNMAQSRAWQANGLREQQRYSEALQTIEAALRLVSQQRDTASIRLQAHLFASSAEMAAFLGNDTLMQRYLDASQTFLAQLPYEYNDEFDHASWHQYKGTCALILNQNDTATEELQVAIESLPPQSMVRHIITLTPLAIAYARERNRERCLETIKRATTVIKTINSASLNKQFVDYLQGEILVPFADDQDIQALASETQQRLMLGATNVIPS